MSLALGEYDEVLAEPSVDVAGGIHVLHRHPVDDIMTRSEIVQLLPQKATRLVFEKPVIGELM